MLFRHDTVGWKIKPVIPAWMEQEQQHPVLPGWAGLVPEETFTCWHLSWIMIIKHPLSACSIDSILPVQFTCLAVFLHNVLFGLLPGLEPSTSYSIHYSSSYHYVLFITRGYTIAACSTDIMSSIRNLFLISLGGTLFCTLMSHIHLIILISVR